MRINAITNVNYRTNSKPAVRPKKEDNPVKTNEVNFKGLKGATVGTLAGLGFATIVSAMSGPLMPLTFSVLALCGSSGAIAGHNIEKDLKNDK